MPLTETGPETVHRILASYEVGKKLRQLRLRKKIALVELGKHTGLSASMISQLENGKLAPTLPTLARIAMVFDVGLDYFFGGRRKRGLFEMVRSEERMRFPDKEGSENPQFFFECLAYSASDKSLQAYLADFPRRPEDEITPHLHPGAEFLHLLEGNLVIHYQDEEHSLKAGDSVYFDSSELHSYRATSKKGARALIITTPPRP